MKVLITDYEFPDVEHEKRIFAKAGIELLTAQCRTPEAVIAVGREADALLVQFAPITREVLATLKCCRIIVRYGIGTDTIDLAAAKAEGISVCNVPDYASGEVADHAVSLALALARQLPFADRRLRGGIWKIVPDDPMPAFRDMRFVTLGFGRIAREVMRRAQGFGFQTAAYDPFVPAHSMQDFSVTPLSLSEAFATADILSMHLPLTAETEHIVNRPALASMKPTAILVNTARGGLVDTVALAEALRARTIFSAGLDVYEEEPLPPTSPILQAPRALLTSHLAWYSDASAPRLQQMAAEEVVRGLRSEPLRSQVNL